MTGPDGLIEPGGATLHHLIAPVPPGDAKLPRAPSGTLQPTVVHFTCLPKEGVGYYRYSPSGNQFGTQPTLDSVQSIAKSFSKNSGVDMGIGDISFADGKVMPPHVSHRRGTNVDIRPIRKDKAHTHTAITEDTYSRDLTKKLVAAILADPNVRRVLFNDKDISGVHFHKGHDNHLHVEMKK